MALIDKDALIDKIDDISRGYTSVYGVTDETIYDAKEIEAIPVEWIEKYIEEMEKIDFIPEAMHVSTMMSRWKEEQKK